MNIILDTNIIRQDLFMNGRDFNLLFDYLKKTSSWIILPEIVYKEIIEIYTKQLRERIDKLTEATESLNRLLVDKQVSLQSSIDLKTEQEKYLEVFKNKSILNLTLPMKVEYLQELVERAIKRKKPFTDKGEEFRDALLWLTLMDFARQSKDETLAFISNDANAFGFDNNLYETLQAEADSTNINIRYFNSIKKFIESVGVKVDYITEEWLYNSIKFGEFEEYIKNILVDKLKHLTSSTYEAKEKKLENLEFNGRISISSVIGFENIGEYYIYEKADGTLEVQANFYIEYEMGFNWERHYKSLKEYERREYRWDSYEDVDYDREVYKYKEVEIIFNLSIDNNNIVSIELSSVYF